MRRFFKWVGVAVGLGVIAAGVFLVPTIWFKPWSIDHFYMRVFLRFALRHPMLLSQLRVLEPIGIEFHSGSLDDFSMAFQRREARFVDHEIQTLKSFDRRRMSDDRRLSADVLEWFLDDQQDANRFMFYDYPVNQLWGVQSILPDFMVNTHVLKKPRDAENYLRRISRFGPALDQVIEGMRWRAAHGIVPPRFVLRKVVVQTRAFADTAARDNVLARNFERKLGEIPRLSRAERDTLRARLEREIDRTVRPAYRRLTDYLVELEHRATDDAGVWKLPNGDAYYAHCLRSHTTTELSADSIHALGLGEVVRVQDEMREILRSLGIKATDPAAEIDRLASEPRFHYPAGDSGRRMILADYSAIIADAGRRTDSLFDLRPRAPVRVERVPAFKEATAPGAYYDGPSFDGARPGIFYANLRDPGETVRFDMRTLAYHEAVPGHHFQIAIAMERRNLPFFRRVIPFTAYAEGWGLYAEHLAYESGFETDPYDRLGALKAELFRAARLVVDTGIHRKRWTREQAIDYMVRTTGMQESQVVTEVERYIVAPGQACAYKVGELEIVALRERARDRLGSRFDLRKFHDVVLENGAVPLGILERMVDEWIASELRVPPPERS